MKKILIWIMAGVTALAVTGCAAKSVTSQSQNSSQADGVPQINESKITESQDSTAPTQTEESSVNEDGQMSPVSGWQLVKAKNGRITERVFYEERPETSDITDADAYEILPVYIYEGKLPKRENGGYEFHIPEGTYDFTIKNLSGGRRDVYVNSQMLVNNFQQDGNTPGRIEVHDIVIKGSDAVVALDDCGAALSTRIEIVPSPSIVKRTRKIYVLGDSLACIYYNGGDVKNNNKTGFGQVLQDYIKNAEVVNLGNSGQTAEGLIATAFTQVTSSAKEGDLVLFEAGYNDRNYSSEENMKAALNEAVAECQKIGAKLIFISPNASPHDYKDTVSWTGYMEDVVRETGTAYIDLGELSYQFLHERYGEDTEIIQKTYVVSDRLHSTYRGANKWASLIAGKLLDLGYVELVNQEYQVVYNDALRNQVICKAVPERWVTGRGFSFCTENEAEDFVTVKGGETLEEDGYGVFCTREIRFEQNGISAERNYVFKVKVPNGNYTVTVATTADKVTSETVESVKAKCGIEKTTETFDVCVCDGVLDLTFPAETVTRSVMIAPVEEKTKREKPYLFVIGDSTSKNTADGAKSWGNVVADRDVKLPEVFGGFENHGMAGRDSVSFYNQGRLEAVLLSVHPGDYVTVNMGINSKETGEQGAYEILMRDYYVKGIMQRGAIPVILTATPDGPVGANLGADYNAAEGKFTNNRGNGARNDKLRKIATEYGLELIEVGQWGEDWMNSLTMEDVKAYNGKYGTDFATVLEMVQSWYLDHNHYKQYLGMQLADFILGELEQMANPETTD